MGSRCGRTHHTGTAQRLGSLEGGFDVLNANVEDRVAVIAVASSNAPTDAGSVFGGDALEKPISLRIRDLFGHRRRGVEGPASSGCAVLRWGAQRAGPRRTGRSRNRLFPSSATRDGSGSPVEVSCHSSGVANRRARSGFAAVDQLDPHARNAVIGYASWTVLGVVLVAVAYWFGGRSPEQKLRAYVRRRERARRRRRGQRGRAEPTDVLSAKSSTRPSASPGAESRRRIGRSAARRA
jgi:hypothetical protein